MASEPSIDRVVGAIQLARARAKYLGVTKGVTASLLDIQWLLDQMRARADEGSWDRETHQLVKRYLEVEVPYRVQQMKELLGALEEVGNRGDVLPQKLEELESERERQVAWVGAEPEEGSEGEAAKKALEDLAGFTRELDSAGKELDRLAHDFLVSFIQSNRLSKELADSLLEREEAADG